MTKSAVEEMEQPAKRWQVQAIQDQVQTANKKLDVLIAKDYITPKELIESEKKLIDFVNGKIEVIETKYSPIYKLFWALMTAIVIESGLLVFQLVKG